MEPRPLSADEVAVLQWLLARALVVRPSSLNLSAEDTLRVVGGCSCGCVSVDFVLDGQGSGASPVADAFAVWPDGARAGVILWAKGGRLSGLEVYDQTPGASARPLAPELLRTYEDPES